MLSERKQLETRWLTLTREVLPSLAIERGWPVRSDHCFQRILLDAVCGGVWYDRIAGRPAYACAEEEVLERAVALGEACVEGRESLDALNAQSLRWRGASRRRATPDPSSKGWRGGET